MYSYIQSSFFFSACLFFDCVSWHVLSSGWQRNTSWALYGTRMDGGRNAAAVHSLGGSSMVVPPSLVRKWEWLHDGQEANGWIEQQPWS